MPQALRKKRNYCQCLEYYAQNFPYSTFTSFLKKKQMKYNCLNSSNNFTQKEEDVIMQTPPKKIDKDVINNFLINNAIQTESTLIKMFTHLYHDKKKYYKEDPLRMQID